jgi:glycerophosphoryl diester phosphodiesterase
VRRHPFFTAPQPLVFAHRGGALLAPENTMAAFARGLALGADGLELDVRLSQDGQVVVHHDATLDRTTPLRGPLNRRTAADLEAAGVPRLATVLDAFGGVRVIVEMKLGDEALADAVIDVVRTAHAVPRVCLGAFSGRVLRRARQLEPALATSASREEVRWALYRCWIRRPRGSNGYAGYQIPERAGATRVVSRRFIDHAHQAGLGVQVWTVNDQDDARRLLEWGVDGLITDRPDVMVPLVRTVAGSREPSAGLLRS